MTKPVPPPLTEDEKMALRGIAATQGDVNAAMNRLAYLESRHAEAVKLLRESAHCMDRRMMRERVVTFLGSES